MTDEEIGERLKEARRNRGMTQPQLAKLLGVSQSQISKYERGDNGIPLDTLTLACDVLQIDKTTFFQGAPLALSEAPSYEDEVERRLRELLPHHYKAAKRRLSAGLLRQLEDNPSLAVSVVTGDFVITPTEPKEDEDNLLLQPHKG